MEQLVEKIIEAPVFRGCRPDMLEDFLAGAPHRVRRREEGAHIVYMGDTCNDLVVLVEGIIYSTMTSQEGKEVVVETLTGPVVLAPAFVFASDNRFPVHVMAKTECTVLYISREAFLELLHRDSRMMMNFIAIISDRCQRLSRRLSDFALLSLEERVLEYMRKQRRIDNVGWLSRVLGVARPSLSRVLSKLKAEGVIERTLDGIRLRE